MCIVCTTFESGKSDILRSLELGAVIKEIYLLPHFRMTFFLYLIRQLMFTGFLRITLKDISIEKKKHLSRKKEPILQSSLYLWQKQLKRILNIQNMSQYMFNTDISTTKCVFIHNRNKKPSKIIYSNNKHKMS